MFNLNISFFSANSEVAWRSSDGGNSPEKQAQRVNFISSGTGDDVGTDGFWNNFRIGLFNASDEPVHDIQISFYRRIRHAAPGSDDFYRFEAVGDRADSRVSCLSPGEQFVVRVPVEVRPEPFSVVDEFVLVTFVDSGGRTWSRRSSDNRLALEYPRTDGSQWYNKLFQMIVTSSKRLERWFLEVTGRVAVQQLRRCPNRKPSVISLVESLWGYWPAGGSEINWLLADDAPAHMRYILPSGDIADSRITRLSKFLYRHR